MKYTFFLYYVAMLINIAVHWKIKQYKLNIFYSYFFFSVLVMVQSRGTRRHRQTWNIARALLAEKLRLWKYLRSSSKQGCRSELFDSILQNMASFPQIGTFKAILLDFVNLNCILWQ